MAEQTQTAFQVYLPEATAPKQKNDVWKYSSILFSTLGILATIHAFFVLYDPPSGSTLAYLAGFIGIVLGTVARFTKFPRRILGGLLLLVGVLILIRHQAILEGIHYFRNFNYMDANHSEIELYEIESEAAALQNMKFFFSIAALLLSLLFQFLTLLPSCEIICALLSFLIVLPGLYQGLELPFLSAIPMLLFWCIMIVTGLCMVPSAKTRIAILSTGLILAVLLAILLYGVISDYSRPKDAKEKQEKVQAAIASMELDNLPDSLTRIGNSIGITTINSTSSTLGTKTKIVYSGKELMKIKTDAVPTQALYIKSFTGSYYDDSTWETVDFEENDAISDYDCAPQNFAFLFNRVLMPSTTYYKCTITTKSKTMKNALPYGSYASTGKFESDCQWNAPNDSYSVYVLESSSNISDVLTAFPITDQPLTLSTDKLSDSTKTFLMELGIDESELDNDPLNLTYSSRMGSIISDDSAINDEEEGLNTSGKFLPAVLLESLSYRSYVHDTDLQIPEDEDLQDFLESLPESVTCHKNPQSVEEINEAMCAIRDYMADNAEYTTSPGVTPKNREFISFFLTESHKGYCTYFAAAGTIIARYLGIPARYCEGVLVGMDSIAEHTKNGAFSMTATDRNAHAWMEYYIDGYGWIDYEMTPGFYSLIAVDSENNTEETTTQTETQTQTQTQTVTETQTELVENSETSITSKDAQGGAIGTDVTTTGSNGTLDVGNDNTFTHVVLPIILKVILAILGLIGLLSLILFLLTYTRRKSLEKEKQLLYGKNVETAILTAYERLLRLGKFLGMPYHNQQLSEYQTQLQTRFTELKLPVQDIPLTISTAQALSLGNQTPTQEQQYQIAEYILQLQHSTDSTLSIPKRLLMRYILHLI